MGANRKDIFYYLVSPHTAFFFFGVFVSQRTMVEWRGTPKE